MTFNLAKRLAASARWAIVLAAMLTGLVGAGAANAQSGAVRVTQTTETYTLANAYVTATVSKRTGDLVSLTYKGTETLSPDAGGHSAAYWSHDTTGGKDVVARVSIDPATNGGERAEVSVKGISGGVKMGHGPGSATTGDIALDIDTRWALGREDRGVYTYVAFEHRPEYPAGTMTEARIAVELQDYFDSIHVDALRSGKYPIDMGGQEGDKYAYTTRQKDERAAGWTSSAKHLGWFLINPSTEYLSGGPNKAEFVAHKEPSPGPAVLNYWRSSHYGGANVTVAEGERWVHVVGPFMFYVNEGQSHEAMVADAQAQLKKEEAKWPYAWVDAEGYAKPAERSTVTGQIALDDRYAPNGGRFTGKLMVGLTKTPYQIPRLGGPAGQAGAPAFQTIEWQNDAKFLQHWSKNLDPSGRFTIEKVPPGTYTLFAYADGVLGEYSKANVTVPAGGKVDLGRLVWTPVRYGRTLWEVGVADRDPREFAYADHFFQPASQAKYAEMFPQGVVYRIGRSTPAKDWFFVQAPHAPAGVKPAAVAMSGVSGAGEATPYRIVFDMPQAGRGAATLRFAFTSYSAPGIEVSVNGTPVGIARGPGSDGAIGLHQIFGRYSETTLAFDASLLKAGENTVTLNIPAGAYNNTVVYDVVRLELDEAAGTPPKPTELTLPPSPPVAAAIPIAQRLRQAPTPSQVITVHDDARFGLPSPTVGGSRYFAEGNAIMAQAGSAAPRRLAAPAKLDVWAVSPDGKRLAYASPDNPDDLGSPLTIRVVDTTTGAQVDEVKWARQTAIAWTPDSKGFYYSGGNVPPPGVTTTSGGLVLYHALGQPRADDRRVLWSDRFGMAHYAEITDDGRWLVINGSVRADGKSEINLIDLTEPKPAPFKAMRRLSERWQFAGSNGSLLYFVTDFGAERGRVVSMDTSKSSLPIVEVVPEAAERLQAARLKNGQMSLSYAGASAPIIRTVGLNTLAAR